MKSPVLEEFPFYCIGSEARVRESYLVDHYLPDVRKQEKEGIFKKMLQTLYFKKIAGFGMGRSGAGASDFVKRMKARAKYTGRRLDGKVRPMCYFLTDLSITFMPPSCSSVLLISGSGKKESVISKSRGCTELGIDTIVFSYEPMSVVTKCSTVYHHIPRKIDGSSNRGAVDVMGNSVETASVISGYSLVEGLVDYHESEDLEKASGVSLRYIENSTNYVHHLGKSLKDLKQELISLGVKLSTVDHVRMSASGDNAASLRMAMNRLAHTGRDGINSSIDFISSDDFGPPGYSDIQNGDFVIISSSTLGSSNTIAIGREATSVGADLCLIASDRLTDEMLEKKLKKFKIKKPDILIKLPYSLPGSDERFFDLGVRHVLEYEAAGVFKYLGLTKKDVEALHLQKELE